MENDCDLLNHTATLTTGAPVDENGEDKSLTVTYGLNCIQYSLTDSEHGSVTEADGKRKTGATVGAVIEPVISLDLGYDIDTLSAVRNDNKQNVDVTDNKSFVMPPASVTLNASFKLAYLRNIHQCRAWDADDIHHFLQGSRWFDFTTVSFLR